MDDELRHKILYITEIFSSIQGETSLLGIPTTFIRLSACNLRCSWCDTSYSFKRGNPLTFIDLYQRITSANLRHICMTGGEPLLQKNIYPFMKLLCDQDYRVNIETSGSIPINHIDQRVVVILDIKCPGSGMDHKNHWDNLKQLKRHDQIKFVLVDRKDYDYAKKICEDYDLYNACEEILYSPVHDILHPHQLVSWIIEDNLPVRLNLQMHKYIWSPETRGV